MSALHVVVRPRPNSAPSAALAPLYGLFDVVVDGVNVTARIGEGEALALLGELGHAVAALCTCRRSRVTLQLYTEREAWELGLERTENVVLLTVFRAGSSPEVAVFERRVSLAALRDGVARALDEAPLAKAPNGIVAGLRSAQRTLEASWPATPAPSIERDVVSLSSGSEHGSFLLEVEAQLRLVNPAARDTATVERADLHSLLLLGKLRLGANGHVAQLDEVQVFLLIDQLLLLAEEILSAWNAERPLFRRCEIGGVRIGARRPPGSGPLALSLHLKDSPDDARVTLPEISAKHFVATVVDLATQLHDAILARDPSQAQNLRLVAQRSSTGALAERLEDALCDDSLQNPEPESYASFGSGRTRPTSRGMWEHGGKMRFMPRWVATVPNIDLRATYLCGDRLVVGSNRETAAIDRTSGAVLWRLRTQRAASVVTPAGLARIHPDGRVDLLDLQTGEALFTRHLSPRVPSGASGAVVHTPGLPKLLVLAEGDRQVTAIDLVSGDVRWRHTARRAGTYRMRRAGKLLLVSGGDTALFALDVTTGDVVWRVRDRLPFLGDLCIDHDSALAVSGSGSGPHRLLHLDAWTGEVRWSADIDERPTGLPLVTNSRIVVPTRDRRGGGARAYDRESGELTWSHEPGLVSITTSWLAVDDALLANCDAGTFFCLEADNGRVRYNHVFSRSVDADQPRRLEPVLRNGALFVPQHEVHVVRPRDGEVIGVVPTDLIPDLLRVDERCDVYVAEESGHLAAFGAAPRLSVVKPTLRAVK